MVAHLATDMVTPSCSLTVNADLSCPNELSLRHQRDRSWSSEASAQGTEGGREDERGLRT